MPMTLLDFITESNRIEGINRSPTIEELEAHQAFLKLEKITIADLEEFVSIVQPDAELRTIPGLNVSVGNHVAPPGGPAIKRRLEVILEDTDIQGVYVTHLAYEHLHPFTDGNGRSGRALWLWQMGGETPIGFLHHFYYQTLATQHAEIAFRESEEGI